MHRPKSTSFRLRTPRLSWREFAATDFDALHKLLSGPRVMEFSGPGALTPEQSRERLENFIASYAAQGFGKWAVVMTDSGELTGHCGVELTLVENAPGRALGFRFRPEF